MGVKVRDPESRPLSPPCPRPRQIGLVLRTVARCVLSSYPGMWVGGQRSRVCPILSVCKLSDLYFVRHNLLYPDGEQSPPEILAPDSWSYPPDPVRD